MVFLTGRKCFYCRLVDIALGSEKPLPIPSKRTHTLHEPPHPSADAEILLNFLIAPAERCFFFVFLGFCSSALFLSGSFKLAIKNA